MRYINYSKKLSLAELQEMINSLPYSKTEAAPFYKRFLNIILDFANSPRSVPTYYDDVINYSLPNTLALVFAYEIDRTTLIDIQKNPDGSANLQASTISYLPLLLDMFKAYEALPERLPILREGPNGTLREKPPPIVTSLEERKSATYYFRHPISAGYGGFYIKNRGHSYLNESKSFSIAIAEVAKEKLSGTPQKKRDDIVEAVKNSILKKLSTSTAQEKFCFGAYHLFHEEMDVGFLDLEKDFPEDKKKFKGIFGTADPLNYFFSKSDLNYTRDDMRKSQVIRSYVENIFESEIKKYDARKKLTEVKSAPLKKTKAQAEADAAKQKQLMARKGYIAASEFCNMSYDNSTIEPETVANICKRFERNPNDSISAYGERLNVKVLTDGSTYFENSDRTKEILLTYQEELLGVDTEIKPQEPNRSASEKRLDQFFNRPRPKRPKRESIIKRPETHTERDR